jgi:hypothetical protein
MCEPRVETSTSTLREGPVYKEHRIHLSRLPSGRRLSKIVSLGGKRVPTNDSLTAVVRFGAWLQWGHGVEAVESALWWMTTHLSDSRLKTPGVSPGLKASPAAGWAGAAGSVF